MYRTLAFHEDAYIPKQPMFSIDGLRHSDIETIQGHHTSRRTLLICSLILVTTTGLLATWVFIAKPHFYPKIHMVNRGLDKAPNIEKNRIFQRDSPSILASNGDILHRRDRRSVDILDSSKLRVRRKVSTHKGESSKKRENVKDKKFHYEHVTEKANYPYNDTRLPLDLIPEEYHIHLNIDLTQDNFTGIVKMKVQCEKKTDQIIFHGRRIQPVNITVMNGQSFVSYSKVSYIKQFEMFIVQLDSQLEEDKSYVVIIEYTVGFGKSLAGLYKSFYKDKGVEKTMCSTHFEPTDARSAFPCMDEPLFKAIFHISITRQKNYTALANMPLLKSTEEPFNDTVKDEFHPSVKMSTYLVAFSVNQFKYKEKKTPDGIAVRVYAREEDQERINYAVDAASTIIHYYGTFFNIKYPLPKLDLLALSDFMAGAMEDWGLVSFRSAYLIVDPELSTVEHIRQVTYVIAHELAHQWFGNLVTMKWWNDIWLNEGFANFVEMLGTNKVNPQFNALDLQVPTGWQAAISLDSLNSSHPVRQDVQKASEIDELFDTISYNKGASLLRMVQSFMGQKLENGVDSYLQAHNYSNAESDDLWECLAKASDNELNIKEIMDTWTKQRSFPIVTVSRFDNSTFKITQQSFLFAKTNSTANATKDKLAGINDTLWHIPFTYLTDKNEEATLVWFNEKEKMISVPSNVVWLKANNHTDGFYIVNYDKKTWKALTNQLKNNHQSLSPLDRAGLLHDAFKLTCDRMLDPVILLNLTRYLRFELEFIPFSMLRSKCECISILLHEKSLKQKYMKYIWRLQSHLEVPQMLDDRSDVNRMTVFERMQRYETISFGLKHNFSKELKDKVQVLFKKLVDGETSKGLSPENRALALMYGFDSNKTSHLNFLWEVFRTSPLDSDRRTIMKAFPQFKNYINETLERSMNKSVTRVQDAISLLAQIVKVGFRKDVFDFVVKHYDEYKERYGGGYQMGQLFSEVAGGFNTQEMLHKVEEFLEHHPIGEKNSRTNRQILEKIRNNINRHANGTLSVEFGERVKTWLEHEEQRINGKTVTPSANHSVRSNTTCVLWKKNGVKTDC